MQGQLAGLAELAVAHHQPLRMEIDVGAVQRDRFAHPDPSHRQQADQCGERGPPQRGAQRFGGGDERSDLGIGIQIEARPVRAVRQQVRRGHLMDRVQGVQVGG
ncbi:MAG TPA: hypothetical protein VHH34_03400, partial [Pseudonocardiaceae bacterium]|nr:hypothetical protein [Pseudonocardiaceae bacterium]